MGKVHGQYNYFRQYIINYYLQSAINNSTDSHINIGFRGKKVEVDKKENNEALKELQSKPFTNYFDNIEDITGDRGSIRGSVISVSEKLDC